MRFKHSLKHLKSQKGYTLGELLAVVLILIIISGIVVGIISSTLRGSAKTKATTDMSQNGQYASAVISSMIEDSRNILQINGNDLDDCTQSPASTLLTPAPGVTSPSITLRRIDGGRTVLSCQSVNGVSTIASNGASLVDNNAVQVQNCSFSCTQLVQDPYSTPIVNVSFNVFQKNASASDIPVNISVSNSLRVYSP